MRQKDAKLMPRKGNRNGMEGPFCGVGKREAPTRDHSCDIAAGTENVGAGEGTQDREG